MTYCNRQQEVVSQDMSTQDEIRELRALLATERAQAAASAEKSQTELIKVIHDIAVSHLP
jgi:ribosomal protein L29